MNPIIKDLKVRMKHLRQIRIRVRLYMKQEHVSYPWQLSYASMYFINRFYNCQCEARYLDYDLSLLSGHIKFISQVRSLAQLISTYSSITDASLKDMDQDIEILNKFIVVNINK